MRSIERMFETKHGVIAVSNDGKGFWLASHPTSPSGWTWEALPDLPQEGYVSPMERQAEDIQKSFPKIMGSLGGEFQKLTTMVGHHHHTDQVSPHGSHGCPIPECDFSGTVTEVLEHMRNVHPERMTED